MTTPAFNPNHHPILDLPPHEFVRKANEAGIKLAVETGSFDHQYKCGCAGGVAAFMIDPAFMVTTVTTRMQGCEFGGVADGFDGTSYYVPEKTTSRRRNGKLAAMEREYQAGLAWGSAVRAAALEIQGDLEPTPLKSEGASS